MGKNLEVNILFDTSHCHFPSRQRLAVQRCARPLQVHPPQPPPDVNIDAMETLPFNPSPEMKKFQEFPAETLLDTPPPGNETPAGAMEDGSHGLSSDTSGSAGGHLDLFHSHEVVPRVEQMEQKKRLKGNPDEEGDVDTDEKDPPQKLTKKEKAARSKQNKQKKAAAKKAAAKAKALEKKEARQAKALEKKEAAKAKVLEKKEAAKAKALEKKAQKKDKAKSRAQGKAKPKAKAATTRKGDEHKDLPEGEDSHKPCAKARAAKKRKADKQIAHEQNTSPAQEAVTADSLAVSSASPDPPADPLAPEPPPANEKKSFARRYRPSGDPGKRWDGVKSTFNRLIRSRVRKPSEMEACEFESWFPCQVPTKKKWQKGTPLFPPPGGVPFCIFLAFWPRQIKKTLKGSVLELLCQEDQGVNHSPLQLRVLLRGLCAFFFGPRDCGRYHGFLCSFPRFPLCYIILYIRYFHR